MQMILHVTSEYYQLQVITTDYNQVQQIATCEKSSEHSTLAEQVPYSVPNSRGIHQHTSMYHIPGLTSNQSYRQPKPPGSPISL